MPATDNRSLDGDLDRYNRTPEIIDAIYVVPDLPSSTRSVRSTSTIQSVNSTRDARIPTFYHRSSKLMPSNRESCRRHSSRTPAGHDDTYGSMRDRYRKRDASVIYIKPPEPEPPYRRKYRNVSEYPPSMNEQIIAGLRIKVLTPVILNPVSVSLWIFASFFTTLHLRLSPAHDGLMFTQAPIELGVSIAVVLGMLYGIYKCRWGWVAPFIIHTVHNMYYGSMYELMDMMSDENRPNIWQYFMVGGIFAIMVLRLMVVGQVFRIMVYQFFIRQMVMEIEEKCHEAEIALTEKPPIETQIPLKTPSEILRNCPECRNDKRCYHRHPPIY